MSATAVAVALPLHALDVCVCLSRSDRIVDAVMNVHVFVLLKRLS